MRNHDTRQRTTVNSIRVHFKGMKLTLTEKGTDCNSPPLLRAENVEQPLRQQPCPLPSPRQGNMKCFHLKVRARHVPTCNTDTHKYWILYELQNGLSNHSLPCTASLSPDPQVHRKVVVNLFPILTPQGTPLDRKQE